MEPAKRDLNVLTSCGSLRKRSYNTSVQRALPSLASEDLTMKAAPWFATQKRAHCGSSCHEIAMRCGDVTQ